MNGLTTLVLTFVTSLLMNSTVWRLEVQCRGIMVEPPHRSSLWRYNYNTTVNLRDDSLNCGGYDWQWGVHQGRCGVCGDLYNGTQDNADRGKFDTGIIVRRYRDGHYINITFEVSSNYLGYVEFRLCPRNSTRVVLEQSCFDRYPLWIDESHGTRYHIGSRGGIYDIHIRLPSGLVCRRCVLQWKYKTGYRYNGDEQCKCLGCGRQEQYVNCADIEIAPLDGWPSVRTRERVIRNRNRLVDSRRRGFRSGRLNLTSLLPALTSRLIRPPAFTFIRPSQTRFTLLHANSTAYGGGGATTRKMYVNLTSLTTPSPLTNVTSVRVSSSTVHTDLSPSYVSPDVTSQIMPTPTTKSKTVNMFPRPISRALPLQDIRNELLKRIGNDVKQKGVQLFISHPAEAISGGVSIKKPTTDTSIRHNVNLQTSSVVPNTQFVSVSNILERFYPNYISPFLASLSKSRGTKLKLPPGCDVTSDEFRCVARGIYNQSPGMSQWCEIHCRANNCEQLTFMCDCFCEDKMRTQNSSCHAIAEFKGVEGMDQWCIANCKVGYCPSNTCSVEDCLKPDMTSNGEP